MANVKETDDLDTIHLEFLSPKEQLALMNPINSPSTWMVDDMTDVACFVQLDDSNPGKPLTLIRAINSPSTTIPFSDWIVEDM